MQQRKGHVHTFVLIRLCIVLVAWLTNALYFIKMASKKQERVLCLCNEAKMCSPNEADFTVLFTLLNVFCWSAGHRVLNNIQLFGPLCGFS